MRRVLHLADLAATRAFAAALAPLLAPGDLVALEGDLGAGKSEVARAVIRARAGAEIEVPSPTFTLIQRYELAGLVITHADLYRLGSPEEVRELGLDEAIAEGALLVEWPERAGDQLPVDRLTLTLALAPQVGEDGRDIAIDAEGSWCRRLEAMLG